MVGGGSGGLVAGKEAARLGMKVVCIDFVKPTPTGLFFVRVEKCSIFSVLHFAGVLWVLGGTCVNVGCIPKKLMHQASVLGHSVDHAKSFGWQTPAEKVRVDNIDIQIYANLQTPHSWETMRGAIQDYIGSLNWGYRVALRENGVEYMNAFGEFTGNHSMKVSLVVVLLWSSFRCHACIHARGRQFDSSNHVHWQITKKNGKSDEITADRFLIATGLRPKYGDVAGVKECTITR